MKKLKDIKTIKINPEPAKGKNVDPSQLGQYSAKYQVSESTASLNRYLLARGINPQFVSTATKIAHSKSSQFLKWKQDHMRTEESLQASKLTPEETENVSEVFPTGVQGHVSQAALDSIKNKRSVKVNLGQKSYNPKPKPKKVGFFKKLFAGEEVQLEASKPTALERFRAAAAEREKKHNDIEKERQERLHQEPSKSNVPDRETKKDYMSAAIDRLAKHLNKEEVELEESTGYEKTLKTTTYTPYKSHKGIEVSSKKAKTPKNLHQKYGEDYHIYHGTTKNKNGSGKEKSFVVHDRPLDVKFMHKHSDEEKEAILHHLNKNKHLDTSAFHKSQIPEEVELDEMINEVSSSEVQHHFDKWTNSEHAPYNSDAGDDNKVHQLALGYLRSTNVPKEKHEKLAMHIAHKFHGSGIDEETDITEKNDSHTHAAHYEDPKTGEWTGMNLLIAKDDDDAIRQAHEKCKEGCRLTKVERHITVKEEVEQIDELKKSTVFSWLKQQPVVPEKKPGMSRKDHNKKIKTSSKSWNRALDRLSGYKPTSEDMWQDTQAATQTPADGANGDNEVTDRKRQMSKSARMIKAIYKKHRMVKEDMHDHEKEDKSVATYGKKPKMNQTDKNDSLGENKPQAAATLSGGTTLTGAKRDTIEIDPVMRNRPGQPHISKKYDKKEKNKNDK